VNRTNALPALLLTAALVLVPLSGPLHAAAAEVYPGCGSLKNAYGPFDYRTDKAKLGIVERFHFQGPPGRLNAQQAQHLAGNLDYTLRAFPNHHGALMELTNLAARRKKGDLAELQLPGMNYRVECYLIRAAVFRPDDGMVKLIFGIFEIRAGQPQKGVQLLHAAEKLRPDDANVFYNLGLAYLDLKDYGAALDNAHRAYAMGFPLPGLRDRLKREGKWREPDTAGNNAAGDNAADAKRQQ
jgi:tetratricopeptide (TPR) repeat protein